MGNDALLKCNIPSFVADFVSVTAWVSGKGETYYAGQASHGILEAPAAKNVLPRFKGFGSVLHAR